MKIRTMLLTRGSHGLGAALVKHLAKLGHEVVFTFASSEVWARQLDAVLFRDGLWVKGIQADATDFKRAHTLVDEVLNRHGKLEVLINNVGGAGAKQGPPWQIAEKGWNSTITLNLKSRFNHPHVAAPHFMSRGAGRL